MSAEFLRCPTDLTAAQLAKHFGISDRDVWLPFNAYIGARDRAKADVDIPDTTPIALRDRASGELFTDREDILMKLCMLDQQTPKGLRLAPSDVPPLFDLYLRWDRATGAKKVAAGTSVMHWPLTDAQALARKSIVGLPQRSRSSPMETSGGAPALPATGKRRRRTAEGRTGGSHSGRVDESSLAETVDGARAAEMLLASAAADLERRMAEALLKVRRMRSGDPVDARVRQSDAIRAYATSRILQCRDLPPLHLLPSAVCTPSSLELPARVLWTRPDPRVLYRVFRGEQSQERSTTSQYGDARRQVAFVFADDVLLPPGGSPPSGSDDPPRHARDPPAEGERARRAAAAMAAYASRGCRIVVMDHFADLHHGSLSAAEARLKPLTDLLQGQGTAATSTTVVLSVMSNLTAGQRRGISASFLLPNTGLLQFFVSQLNFSLEVDGRCSVVVGTRHRATPVLDDMHATFAANAGIPFVEVDDIATS